MCYVKYGYLMRQLRFAKKLKQKKTLEDIISHSYFQ